jgi:hypothetical protein
MDEVILWAEFAGAWLLVAGPLYQGSIELSELEVDREGLNGVRTSAITAAGQDPPSAWWWLLPPVMYVLRRRWARAFRKAAAVQLTETQAEQLASFRNKATGWFTVAAGATLLAAGETWQITGHYGWPAWLFWLLTVGMLAAVVLNTAIQRIRDEHARHAAGSEPAPAAAELS